MFRLTTGCIWIWFLSRVVLGNRRLPKTSISFWADQRFERSICFWNRFAFSEYLLCSCSPQCCWNCLFIGAKKHCEYFWSREATTFDSFWVPSQGSLFLSSACRFTAAANWTRRKSTSAHFWFPSFLKRCSNPMNYSVRTFSWEIDYWASSLDFHDRKYRVCRQTPPRNWRKDSRILEPCRQKWSCSW